ncbi:putative ATPase family associated with various cellular activities (AAA) [Streptomyces himastatinicus ATCC 53653]|uniref:Putative ATPase family associated with various cellular activities (AAA) n=1 Tax=Streptomyces himastatinicus ATCC 53653 TaxID=457427 RepID=D9WA95_9ACTN|nr:putative ATPase family associated with various cellular activities (AAA) [Streptomyces himastatinicus ATCC 53653]
MRKNGRMAEGGDFWDGLAGRIANFNREAAGKSADTAEQERQRVLEEFPLSNWPELRLERYALGPAAYGGPRHSFCRLLEYGTNTFGSIRGGSAAKHIVFQHRTGEWRIVPSALRGLSVDEAWAEVRTEFVTAFAAATDGDYGRIDDLESLSYGQALTTKALAVYFPDDFLPIFSASHVRHFTALLGGRPHQYSSGVRTWRANRELLNLVRKAPEFEGWRLHEVMAFLYSFHDPRPKDRVIWKIAPGERAGLWDDCLSNRRIRIGWDEVGSLGQYESDQELKEALDQYWPRSTGGNLRLARQMLAFRDLESGDLIIANRGKSEVLAVGTVTDGYSYAPDVEKYRHTVGVDWDTSYAQFFDSPRHAWQQTLAKVPATLWQEIRHGRKTALAEAAEPVAGTDAELPDSVREVQSLLDHKGQVVLQGPPGTGKTRLALSVALAMAGRGDQIEAPPEERAAALAELSKVPGDAKAAHLTMATFHPSYGYEDFVEGFKPDLAATGAGLNLTMTDGLFRRVCAAAEEAPDETFLIVVDEINRGDLPRILGELITLLELDKRGSVYVTLPTSGRQQTVPKNVRIIGTMNSADRSVGHIDVAIRRRFAFLDVPPDLDVLDGEVEGLGLADFLEGLNAKLDQSFGPDHLLGQAYLLADDRPLATAEQLSHAFHHEIVPLVADYCLGQPELLRSVLGKLVDNRTGRVVQTNPQDLPGMLADEFANSASASEERASGESPGGWGGE